MKQSEIVNHIHSFTTIYLLFGWILQSQRIILVFMLPTVQFQWLVNDNKCFLTQIEHQLLNDERKKDDSKKEK